MALRTHRTCTAWVLSAATLLIFANAAHGADLPGWVDRGLGQCRDKRSGETPGGGVGHYWWPKDRSYTTLEECAKVADGDNKVLAWECNRGYPAKCECQLHTAAPDSGEWMATKDTHKDARCFTKGLAARTRHAHARPGS